jgi:hypothetical protein
VHFIDGLACLDEQTGLVDFELGRRHVLAERARLRTELLEERKYLFLDDSQRLVSWQLAPVRPAQLLLGEKRLEFLATFFCRALGVLLAFIELLEEKQK